MKVLNQQPNFFNILGFRVIGDSITLSDVNRRTISEASVKIQIEDEIIHTVSEGDGPVNALDKALRKAIVEKYPEVANFKLDDFKVRILDSKAATGAPVRVTIESSDGLHKWDTVGVSENIIEASYGAIVDSIYYGLILQGAKSLVKQ